MFEFSILNLFEFLILQESGSLSDFSSSESEL